MNPSNALRSVSAFACLLLLSPGCAPPGGDSGSGAPPADLHVSAGDKHHTDGTELCDGEDNNADGVIDEGCDTCDYLVTRTTDFYARNECVVEGDATGFSLLPVTLGGMTINDFPTLQTLLLSRFAGRVKVALGQQVVTARLNATLFNIGDLPYHDIDHDGVDETVDEIIDAADAHYTYGTAGEKRMYYTLLGRLNAEGAGLAAYFDEACVEPPELCDGIDNNGNGDVDESCGCIEVCDGVDNDDDGTVDESGADADGDGAMCDDCDDTDPTVHPGAAEVENGIDDDCNDLVDDGTAAYDDDGDGYAESAGDCNDADASISPVSPELANGIDDDCDGTIDEGTVNFDDDLDGYAEVAGDCNDADAAVSPDATEVANGIDDDCDGVVDEGTAEYDDDGDGTSEAGGDCNDADASVHPGATESANGIDDDCDGIIDEGTTNYDDDHDGYSEAAGDCNDAVAAVHPGVLESCNGVDDNCNGRIDDGITRAYYRDRDSDGYGGSIRPLRACTRPSGYSARAGDCNDSSAAVHPGATEACNGTDDDCDGQIDEGC